jgi:hypothetical protein
VQADAAVSPGQISQRALVATVDPTRSAGAARAACGAARAGQFKGHAVIGDQDAFKAEATQLREEGKQEACKVHVNFLECRARPCDMPSPELYRPLFRVHRNCARAKNYDKIHSRLQDGVVR